MTFHLMYDLPVSLIQSLRYKHFSETALNHQCLSLRLKYYVGLLHNLHNAALYILSTVNIEMFVQYIFSRISRRPLCARRFDMNENYHHSKLTCMCAKIKHTNMLHRDL